MRCEIQRAHALVADVGQIGALAIAGATSGREIGCKREKERERERGEFDETVEANFGTIPSKGFDDRGIREPRRARVANHRGTKCRFTAIVTAFVSQFKAFVLDSNGIYIPARIKDRTRLRD